MNQRPLSQALLGDHLGIRGREASLLVLETLVSLPPSCTPLALVPCDWDWLSLHLGQLVLLVPTGLRSTCMGGMPLTSPAWWRFQHLPNSSEDMPKAVTRIVLEEELKALGLV